MRAQRGRRPCASRDPSVDPVERERYRRERHQHRNRGGPAERVRDQRCHADGECGPSKGHPVGQPQLICAVAGEAVRQRQIREHCAADSDDPTGAAEPDGPRERSEEQHLSEQPSYRADMGVLDRP